MDALRTNMLPRDEIGEFIKSPRGIRSYEELQGDATNIYEAISTASFLTITDSPSLGSERTLTLTGDLDGADGGPNAPYTLGLSDTTVVPGPYGSASKIGGFTVNAKGRITAAMEYALNSDNVTEGAGNLFFTVARARTSLSATSPLSYNSGTGVFSVTGPLAAYAGGDTPSAFTLGIVDSADAAAWRTAIGAGTSSTTGTVTAVTITTANGVSASVANQGTTPALTVTLGAITPSSVAASGAMSGSNLSGTNTGDQTSVSGNAGTATALATSRNFSISGGGITASTVGFNGTAAVVLNASVDAGHITLTRMANVATATVFYRKTAGTGAPEVQTLATLKTDLGLTGTNSGDQTITLTGDVTGSGTGSFAVTVGANKVTLAQMAQVATATFLGRTTAGTGDVEALTATQATAMLNDATGALPGRMSAADFTKLAAVKSGTFTPTLTNVANVSSSTAFDVQYLRVDNTVTASGRVDIAPTAAGVDTQLRMTLPVASALTGGAQLGGAAFCTGVASQGAGIIADPVTDQALFRFVASASGSAPFMFSFTYRVI